MKQTELQSGIFPIDEYKRKLDEFIEFLKAREIVEADVVFGFAWGCEIGSGDWSPQRLRMSEIHSKISEYEQEGFGQFGNDEIEFLLEDGNISVLFCHEHDVHLRYSSETGLGNDLKNLFGMTAQDSKAPSD